MSFEILWLPVLISTVLFMPFGAFYYSTKGMGDQWLKAIGKTAEDIKAEETNMGLLMGSTFVISFVTVLLINFLIVSIGVTIFLDLLLIVGVVYLVLLLIRLKNSLFDGNMALFKVNLLGTLGEFIILLVVFSFFV